MKFVPERDPLPRILAFCYLGVAVLAGGVFILWGRHLKRLVFCPLRSHLGIPCPTCGGTHAALALVRGDLVEAFRQNPLVVLTGIALIIWLFFAIAGSLVPGWRRQLELTPREVNMVRLLLIGSVLAVWIYEIIRLT
jgi:hypothetical protein